MKFLIPFILLSLSLYAQTGIKTASLENDGKALWNVAKPNIAASGYKYYIRYEYGYRVVNLYANDSLNFEGFVVNYLREGTDEKNRNYVYDVARLPKENCSTIGQKILSEKFYNFPVEDSISGYNKGWLDCWSVHYTFKINNTTITKEYACPTQQQDSLTGIKLLKENLKLTDSIMQLKKIYNDFDSRLEGGKSYYNGYWNMYKFTPEQKAARDRDKPRRAYLESKKDTINNAIEAYITDNYKDEGDCYDDFTLDFNKRGKVIKISTDTPFWERLFDKDYHRCRRNVKKLFRKFNLKELELKYGFTRDLNFRRDDVPYIYDRTIY